MDIATYWEIDEQLGIAELHNPYSSIVSNCETCNYNLESLELALANLHKPENKACFTKIELWERRVTLMEEGIALLTQYLNTKS